MAQLLIRIEPRSLGKQGAYYAGDVVNIQGDEHVFSPAEVGGVTGVPLRVVKVPGITPKAMAQFTLANASTRRTQGFDLSGSLGGILRAATEPVVLSRAQAWELLLLSRAR